MSINRLTIKKIDSTASSFITLSTIVLLVWLFFKPFNSIFSEFLLLPSFFVYLLMVLLAGTSCFLTIKWIMIQTTNSPHLKNILLGVISFLIIYTGHAIYAYATNRFQHFHWIPIFGISFLVFFLYKQKHFQLFPIFISLIVLGMGLYESVLAVLQYFFWRYPNLHSNLLLYPYQRFCYMHDGISFIKTVIRPMGTFDSPITLGIFLAALLPIAIWLFPRTGKIQTISSILGILIIAAALVLTYSRAAAFSALSILIVSATAYYYMGNKSLSWVSLFIAIFLTVCTFGNHWAFERWKHGIYMEDKSVVNRVAVWKNSQSIILHQPLLGVGLGNFGNSYELYNPMPANITEEMQDQYRYTNNNYWLSLWCEIGLPGLLSIFTVIAILSACVIKKIKLKINSALSLIPLWGTVIILILTGFSNSSLGHPFLNLWMWVLISVVLAQLAVEWDSQQTS